MNQTKNTKQNEIKFFKKITQKATLLVLLGLTLLVFGSARCDTLLGGSYSACDKVRACLKGEKCGLPSLSPASKWDGCDFAVTYGCYRCSSKATIKETTCYSWKYPGSRCSATESSGCADCD